MGYKIRTSINEMLWMFGYSYHNNVDNECCPDFSCCIGGIKTKFLKRVKMFVKDMVRIWG